MIICHCEVVSDRQVEAAVDCGAVCADDIARSCAAGTQCGACRPTIEALLATLLADTYKQTAA